MKSKRLSKKIRIFLSASASFAVAFVMAVPVWADIDPSQPSGAEQTEVSETVNAEPSESSAHETEPSVTDPTKSGSEGSTASTGAKASSAATKASTKASSEKKKKILKGWQKIDGSKYYYDSKGKPVTGIKKISGKVYSFGKDGKLNKGASGKMDVKAYSESSKTKYLILVNCSTHRVGVYKGKKANWKRIHYWKCGDGKKSTPTVKGTFKTGKYLGRKYKQRYFDSYSSRCWYATRIYNGYLFHSVLYTRAKTPVKIKDGRLGAGVSHGCIRLDIKNAKWIYDHIGKNTKVIIYK